MDDTASLLQGLLAFAWAPMLVAAGVLDWALHRAQRIEFTAGIAESALHLAMLVLVGSAILAALLLEPTAGLLACLIGVVLLHDLSYLADLRVALAKRRIPILEQWVHGFQHLLPWAGLSCLLALAPGQTLALLQRPGYTADWALRFKADPPWTYTAVMFTISMLLNVLPFCEEAWRSLKVAQRR
ncbi:hypothetical protein J2X20_000885 [Pelomonas saccharophila]|uniref:Diguanylate cyclase n=1 Tax=Roseateles saccharophilus TaxID=304 RepID=A0ABU1YJR2_ROSSA|nr:hypothetical protein [Roseateles saccharophilus]MDR7268256.1 hypothetical protein [Roseateles saccharophilus]